MRNGTPFGVIALLVATGCSSGPNPVVGKWTATVSPQAGATDNLLIAINADGSIAYTVTGTGACSGTLTVTGLSWTTSGTTLATTWQAAFPTGSCSGAGITCPGAAGTLTCSSSLFSPCSCGYQLASNNTSLVLSGCTNANDVLDATYSNGP